MAKIIDLGSAGPDDPIYSSGPLVHFKPPLPASKGAGAEMKGGDAPTALLEAPSRAQFESEEEAQNACHERVGRIQPLAKRSKGSSEK